MNRARTNEFARITALGACLIGSFVITAASVAYFNGDELPSFMVEKLPLPHEELWLFALRAHVFSAALALPICVLLMSKNLLRRASRLHRWMGRVIGMVILLALVPSGLYLSLFAKGGVPSTIGFALSGAIVFVAMVQGIRAARRHDLVAHRRAMLHVLAQLSVAVTSRTLLVLCDAVGVDAEVAYLVSLWLPVLCSVAFVERIHAYQRRSHESVQLDPSSRHTFFAGVARD